MSSTATVTVLFCDVVGSTERLVRIGDVAGDALRRALFGRLRRSVEAAGGIEVKNLGDGLMVVFPRSSVAALACARSMHEAAAGVDPEDPVRLRIGISVGEVAEEDGDWFGLPVVEAARLCAVAETGQTLAVAHLRTLVGTRAGEYHLRDAGTRVLKGLAAPVAVVEVPWRDDVAPVEVGAGELGAAALGADGTTGALPGPDGQNGTSDQGGPDEPIVLSPSDPPSGPLDAGPLDADTEGAGNDPAADRPASADRRRRFGRRRRDKVQVLVVGIAALVLVALGGTALVAALGDDPGGTVAADDGTGGSGGDGGQDEGSSDELDMITTPKDYEPQLINVACDAATEASVPDATCAHLIVPESRAKPDDRTVSIPITRRPAEQGATAAPVVLLDVNEPLATTELAEHSDVYRLSLRGFSPQVGPNLDCPELRGAWEPTLAVAPDDPAAMAARVEAATACADRLRRQEGVQLEGYNMSEVADDLRDLVLVEQLDEVTVAAGGFTTTAATEFARTNPGSVQGLLLNNPVAPGASPLQDPARWLGDAFERLAALCRGDETCDAEHPDLVQEYRDVAEELAREPQLVQASSLVGTGPHTVLMDERRWAAALEAALHPSGRLGMVPQGLRNVGDELLAGTGIDEEVKGFISASALAGAMLSYTCAYDAAPHATAEISSRANPDFAGADEPTFDRLCRAWGVPTLYEEMRTPLVGDVPVLLAQGELSVAGTNDWAGEMAEGLEHARVLRFDTLSEDLAFDPPGCLRRLRAEFAQDPDATLDVEDCEAQTPEIDFAGSP